MHTRGCAHTSVGSCGGHKECWSPWSWGCRQLQAPGLVQGNKLALPQLQDSPFTRTALQPLAVFRVFFVYHHSCK